MTKQAIYRGFSTNKWLSTNGKTLKTANIEAVKQELMNHIYTGVGERVAMPNWGTRIPFMVFEMNDELTRQIIYDDIRMAVEYDPRLKLIAMQLISLPDNNSIVCLVDCLFVEFQVTQTLRIEVAVGSG